MERGRGLICLHLRQVRETGWSPHHLIVREEGSETVLGCCPIYMKVEKHLQSRKYMDGLTTRDQITFILFRARNLQA